jgi:hypothetical protein
MDVRVELHPRLGWLRRWRPRAVAADAGGLAIERAGGAERVGWDEIDAVVDGDVVLIEARGRVVARVPDVDGAERLVAAVVERAGLEWVEPARRRGGLPRMAVRPAVAARLRA